jgi:hypothetical protein
MIMSTLGSDGDAACLHIEFLVLLPVVERHAKFVFRGHPDREEAVAEAVAASFESFLAIKARGKNPHDFPSSIAKYAVLHVKDDRHVGGTSSSTDVLSSKAQRRHGFRVMSLAPANRLSAYEERLRDDRRTPVPDQVAFRIDWPAFLKTLTERDRQMTHALAEERAAKEVAQRFRISNGRVTQLRQRWHRDWLVFHGDTSAENEEASQSAIA